MVTVLVSGGFDRFHEGHLDHIQKASKLGDYLVVVVATDEAMYQKKGRCLSPQGFRRRLLRAVLKYEGIDGEVIPSLDDDGTTTETLKIMKPNIFAKGGDRVPLNMPQSEIDACEELGIAIIYGQGGLLNSSSKE
ncbi:hypothetical protein LCGC14_0931250 [marine sediment metagenome]|uniref:Cytidyltransferase-like domain-containing protein n=1 Tax=marine sediment metagenome TaxID=412755 RepID=A0A0F9RUH0_9ZZZZ